MMLGKVIGPVVFPCFSDKVDLTLLNPVLDPMISHVLCFGFLGFDENFEYAMRS